MTKWGPLFWLEVGPSFGGQTNDTWVPGRYIYIYLIYCTLFHERGVWFRYLQHVFLKINLSKPQEVEVSTHQTLSTSVIIGNPFERMDHAFPTQNVSGINSPTWKLKNSHIQEEMYVTSLWFQFFFHPYLGKWSNLTNIFQIGWNHQLGKYSLHGAFG